MLFALLFLSLFPSLPTPPSLQVRTLKEGKVGGSFERMINISSGISHRQEIKCTIFQGFMASTIPGSISCSSLTPPLLPVSPSSVSLLHFSPVLILLPFLSY